MRLSLLLFLLMGLSGPAFAQSAEPAPRTGRTKSLLYSASSDWVSVSLRPTPRLRPAGAIAATPSPTTRTAPPATAATEPPLAPRYTPPNNASGYRPAFTGDFVTNRNGWIAGNRGDYNYQIGLGKYSIRKRNQTTARAAFSHVALPGEINLNIAETFTIKVDVAADSGRIPTGGLLFGVLDSLNYCAFSLNSQGQIAIVRVSNGKILDDYMPGDYFKPGVLLEQNRNRLTIRRDGDELHFYINDREVRSSPYSFRKFSGNGVGLTTTGYWTSFQRLSVTLGP